MNLEVTAEAADQSIGAKRQREEWTIDYEQGFIAVTGSKRRNVRRSCSLQVHHFLNPQLWNPYTYKDICARLRVIAEAEMTEVVAISQHSVAQKISKGEKSQDKEEDAMDEGEMWYQVWCRPCKC